MSSAVFDVQDFSCASEWEKVAATIGSSLQKSVASSDFILDGQKFYLIMIPPSMEPFSVSQEVSLEPLVARLRSIYDLREGFVLCHPHKSFVKLSEATKVLGALVIAANTVGYSLPLFTPYGDTFRHTAIGMKCGSISTAVVRYHVDVLPETPPQCQNGLNGAWEILWDAFHAAIGLHATVDESSMKTVLRRSYEIHGTPSTAWDELLVIENEHRATAPRQEDKFRPTDPPVLPWGTDADPVRKVCVVAQWDMGRDDHTQGGNATPQRITLSIRLQPEDVFQCHLTEHVRDVVDMYLETFQELRNTTKVFLTRRQQQSFVKDTTSLVEGIFSEEATPDIDKYVARKLEPYRRSAVWEYPPGSLLSLLAHDVYCTPHLSEDSVMKVWVHFCQVTKNCFEMQKSLPHIAQGLPDWDTSLLNQKLQLLNYITKNSTVLGSPGRASSTQQAEITDGWGFDDDDFGDAQDESVGKPHEQNSPQPVHGMFLFKDSATPLMAPAAIGQTPLTSDMMEAIEAATLSQGTSEAWLDHKSQQHCTLVADMLAFRAANSSPLVSFLDFVRWYSPADIIADASGESEEGYLSERMQGDHNLWKSTWRMTGQGGMASVGGPVMDIIPAHLALKWLHGIPSQQVLMYLLHYFVSNAYWTLQGAFVCRHIPYLRDVVMKRLLQRLTGALPSPKWQREFTDVRERYRDVSEAIEWAERLISLATSLVDLLSKRVESREDQDDVMGLVDSLLQEVCAAQVAQEAGKEIVATPSVEVPTRMWQLLRRTAASDPAVRCEYTLQCVTQGGSGGEAPQLLYCSMGDSATFVTATAIADI